MYNREEIAPAAETVMERSCFLLRIRVREADAPELPAIIQYYRLYQGTLIPLYYGENICGREQSAVEEEYGPDCLVGYFLETGKRCCFFPMKRREEPVMLENGTKLRCGDLELEILHIAAEQEKDKETEPVRRRGRGRRTHGI